MRTKDAYIKVLPIEGRMQIQQGKDLSRRSCCARTLEGGGMRRRWDQGRTGAEEEESELGDVQHEKGGPKTCSGVMSEGT
jgi:hypothetical protein